MNYNIRGDKILVTPAIKEYIKDKLNKLNKYFSNPKEIKANVLVKVKGHNQTIEVTIPTPNFTIRNEQSNKDLYAAIDLVSDKIERQIRKNKTKINKIEKNTAKNASMVFEEINYKEDKTEVVKRKTFDAKPMSEEEAILQMEMLGHDFFIFKDSENGLTCVLYKRKDKNYGIIEAK